jgi:peptide-methionine (R)-S-oxide reductase
MMQRIERTPAEWREQLTPEQYRVLREQGTERPGTSELNGEWRAGTYRCRGCGTELFRAEAKFDAGCGWPSFTDPLDVDRVRTLEDTSHGMRRVEVRCATCDGHLGHVFPDGPGESGDRYCMNGVVLEFVPDEA